MRNNIVITLLLSLLLVGCGTQKTAVGNATTDMTTTHDDPSAAFVASVIANAVDVQNIVGNAAIRLQFGSESMRLAGAVHLRRDEVIRLQLQLPFIGTEVGRIEFTPTYVLFLDRFNKQYVRVAYEQVDFLAKNNISFYSLQSLFWNELIAPAATRATVASAPQYRAALDSGTAFVPITLTDGTMTYQWQASSGDKTLSSAMIMHTSDTSGTTMGSWLYSNFATVAGKKYPLSQEITFSTAINGAPQRAVITIDMSEAKTSADWEATTTPSEKYKEVPVETLLRHLMNL